jgi:predicted nuclease of restriction endonuclease-like RecB superfamily
VKDGSEKFFFPDHANEKINKAEKNNQSKVLLYPEELNLKGNTHKLNFKENIVTHKQSGKKAVIHFHDTGKAEVIIKG